jgi:hypothetical protein
LNVFDLASTSQQNNYRVSFGIITNHKRIGVKHLKKGLEEYLPLLVAISCLIGCLLLTMKEKKIGDFTEAHLLKRAKEVVEEKTKDSAILDVHAEDRIPKFDEKGRLPHLR